MNTENEEIFEWCGEKFIIRAVTIGFERVVRVTTEDGKLFLPDYRIEIDIANDFERERGENAIKKLFETAKEDIKKKLNC